VPQVNREGLGPVKLTVVTPTRNAADYLEACIHSVLANRSDDVVVKHLIVDSGSVDETLEIAARMDVKILHVDPINIHHSINEGNRAALESDVVGLLGGDDIMPPGTARFVADWYRSRRSSWLVGGAEWIDVSGKSLGKVNPPPRWLTPQVYASLGWSWISPQSTFITPEFVEEVGYFDTSFEYSGDFEYFTRALGKRRFDRTSRTLSLNRIHPDQHSKIPDPVRLVEVNRVENMYAPDSRVIRWLYRYLLKLRVNIASPAWFYNKRVSGLLAHRSSRVHR